MFRCYTPVIVIHTINTKFMRVVELANRLENMNHSFGTGQVLTCSQIRLIEIIGDKGELLSVTDLARELDITKGAVSQNLKKLEEKGLTCKIIDPENSSRAIVKLAAGGVAVYNVHKEWHEAMDGGFKEYFSNLTGEQVNFLLEFLARVEDFYIRRLEAE